MREGFSVPEAYSKRQAGREIEEGLAEYRTSPRSKEGLHPELIEEFETETTATPLNRKEVETEAAQFLEKHFRDLLPTLLATGSEVDMNALIRRFGLTNEQIGLLGGHTSCAMMSKEEV